MSEKGILKKIDDIFNYCEEIDNHLPKEEQTGYSMLPDIFYIRKEVHNLQQKVEQLEKENEELKEENKRIFQNVNDDELLISNAMNYAELKKAEKRVEQLENIRKEAIEYIKSYKNDYAPYELSDYNIREILNILNKGSEFNVKENNTNNN